MKEVPLINFATIERMWGKEKTSKKLEAGELGPLYLVGSTRRYIDMRYVLGAPPSEENK